MTMMACQTNTCLFLATNSCMQGISNHILTPRAFILLPPGLVVHRTLVAKIIIVSDLLLTTSLVTLQYLIETPQHQTAPHAVSETCSFVSVCDLGPHVGWKASLAFHAAAKIMSASSGRSLLRRVCACSVESTASFKCTYNVDLRCTRLACSVLSAKYSTFNYRCAKLASCCWIVGRT